MGFFNKEIKIGNKIIGDTHPTYFIAEIGANFDGSIEKAKHLIDAAKEAGADCARLWVLTFPPLLILRRQLICVLIWMYLLSRSVQEISLGSKCWIILPVKENL